MTAATKGATVKKIPDRTLNPLDSLAIALAWLQGQLPEVIKGDTATVPTKSGGKYTYTYATLADCNRAIMPLLAEAGLSFSSKPTLTNEVGFGLAYSLRHVSGETDEGFYPLPDPADASAQEIGSAITYARRYVLCSVTGIAPEDDDGAAATKSEARYSGASRAARPDADELGLEDRPEPSNRDWIAEAEQLKTEEQVMALGRECNAFGEFKGEVKQALIARREELRTPSDPTKPDE